MSSIVIGGNSALWMEHQFAACGNSCNPSPKQPSIELTRYLVQSVFDEETSWLFLESDAECFQLSVKSPSLAFFMCLTTLQKR